MRTTLFLKPTTLLSRLSASSSRPVFAIQLWTSQYHRPGTPTTMRTFAASSTTAGSSVEPPTDEKQALVWRYFHRCHKERNAELLPEIFHNDFVLNGPNGATFDRAGLVKTLTETFWPMLRAGTIEVDLEFLPLGNTALSIPEAAVAHPAAELQRFRGTLTAERIEPDVENNNSLTLHHEVNSVWHIVDGKCRETWPAFDPNKNDADVLRIIDEMDKQGE